MKWFVYLCYDVCILKKWVVLVLDLDCIIDGVLESDDFECDAVCQYLVWVQIHVVDSHLVEVTDALSKLEEHLQCSLGLVSVEAWQF